MIPRRAWKSRFAGEEDAGIFFSVQWECFAVAVDSHMLRQSTRAHHRSEGIGVVLDSMRAKIAIVPRTLACSAYDNHRTAKKKAPLKPTRITNGAIV